MPEVKAPKPENKKPKKKPVKKTVRKKEWDMNNIVVWGVVVAVGLLILSSLILKEKNVEVEEAVQPDITTTTEKIYAVQVFMPASLGNGEPVQEASIDQVLLYLSDIMVANDQQLFQAIESVSSTLADFIKLNTPTTPPATP